MGLIRPFAQGPVLLLLHVLTTLFLLSRDSQGSSAHSFSSGAEDAVLEFAQTASSLPVRRLKITYSVAAKSATGVGQSATFTTNASSLEEEEQEEDEGDEEELDPLVFASGVSEWCRLVVRNSTLYQEQCFQRKPQILRRLLVTGAGGCGTHYAVDLFRESGFVIVQQLLLQQQLLLLHVRAFYDSTDLRPPPLFLCELCHRVSCVAIVVCAQRSPGPRSHRSERVVKLDVCGK